MNEKVFVIYSNDLKSFLSNDGTSLTSEINKAMRFNSVGDAMLEADKAAHQYGASFKFYEA